MQERSELFEMTGSVETIIFRNEKNGYTILEIDNGQEIVTAVGTMPWVSVGEALHIVGAWVKHPSFGTQFKVEAFEQSKPSAPLRF